MENALRNARRTYGTEIEFFIPRRHSINTVCEAINRAGVDCYVEQYNHDERPWWKIVTDSSIRPKRGYRGYEIVSRILKGTQGLEEIKKVCAVLNEYGADVNESTGLHVHHDARDFTSKCWTNIKKIYMAHEKVIDEMMPWSRRANNNGRSRRTGEFLHTNYCASVLDDPGDWATDGDRYYKLNLTAFARHGTVEFRHHSGTVDAKKIIAWIHITQAMVERSHGSKFRSNIKNHLCMFSALKLWGYMHTGAFKEVADQVREYYIKRRRHFKAVA